MYSLVTGFFEHYFRKTEYRALVVGLDGVGKTTLVNSIKCVANNTPVPTSFKCFQTIGMNVEKLSAGGRSTLTVWDLGGDSNFRPVWERYYREANIVVFVIDITSRTRLAEARAELDKLARHPDLYDAPILIVANKCDSGDDHAEDMMSTEEIVRALPMLIPTGVSTLEGVVSATASAINEDVERGFVAARRGNTTRLVQLLSVSAKTGQGVQQLMLWMLDLCSKTERALRLQAEATRQSA